MTGNGVRKAGGSRRKESDPVVNGAEGIRAEGRRKLVRVCEEGEDPKAGFETFPEQSGVEGV